MALNTKHEFLCFSAFKFQSTPIQKQILAIIVLLWNIFLQSLCLANQVTMLNQYEEAAAQMSDTDRGCYILLNNTRGNITVPQRLLKNANFIQCEWDISPGGPLHIQIRFLHIDLPRRLENNRCFGTFLEYGTFDYFGRRLIIDEVCGKLLPNDFKTNENRVWLKYYSIPTDGDSTLPFVVTYEAFENSHLRNTTVVMVSIGAITVIAIAACFICYCQRKKRQDPYYNKRRQQRRLQKIKIRSGLETTTALDWKKVAFKLNQHEHVPVKQGDSLPGSSCSASTATTIASVVTSLKISSDELENENIVCDDPTKYEDISDFVGQENPPNNGKQDPECEPTYLSLHLERSCNGYLPSVSRPTPESQLETVEQNYLSFNSLSLAASHMNSRDSIPHDTSQSEDSTLKSAQVNLSPFLLSGSLDLQVNPLFHSTPDLEATCGTPNVNIPVICINDELVCSFFGSLVRDRKVSCSAPDLSQGSQCKRPVQLSSTATPHLGNHMRDMHYSDPAVTDSGKTSRLHMSFARARPRPTISPIAGVSPGQIHKDFFTAKSEDLKSQSTCKATASPVLNCMFKHQSNAKSKSSFSC